MKSYGPPVEHRRTGYLVSGFKRDDDHAGERQECETVEIAAAVMTDFLRRKFAWVHIDSLGELDA